MFLCYLFIDKLQGWNERGREKKGEKGRNENPAFEKIAASVISRDNPFLLNIP